MIDKISVGFKSLDCKLRDLYLPVLYLHVGSTSGKQSKSDFFSNMTAFRTFNMTVTPHPFQAKFLPPTNYFYFLALVHVVWS